MRRIAALIDWTDIAALICVALIVIGIAAWDWRLALVVAGVGGLLVVYASARASARAE